jgi:hypothetical protein
LAILGLRRAALASSSARSAASCGPNSLPSGSNAALTRQNRVFLKDLLGRSAVEMRTLTFILLVAAALVGGCNAQLLIIQWP